MTADKSKPLDVELPADIEHAIVRLANTGLGSPQLRILIFEYIQTAIQKGRTEK